MLLILLFLVLGPQVALCSFRFNFSTIEQCAPVSISFIGNDDTDRTPSSLLLLPFNSSPVSIPIPNAAANSTGITVTFIPFAAGIQFIASLDDSNRDNVARVSDIFRVQDSATNDSSCLPTTQSTAAFTMPQSVSQCEQFTVGYQDVAPVVRVFSPKLFSFPLDISQDNANLLSADYTLNVSRGLEVVLLAFSEGSPSAGTTSALLTVQGDASSNTSCIIFPKDPTKIKTSKPRKLSTGVVIALGVSGAVALLSGVALGIFIVRKCRQRRQRTGVVSNPDFLEKRFPRREYQQSPGFIQSREYKQSIAYSPPPASPHLSPVHSLRYERGYVENPPYTAEKFSPVNTDFEARPLTPLSWVADPAIPVQYAVQRAVSQKATIRSAKTASSINPYDIERMLDYVAEDQPELPSPVLIVQEPPPPATTLPPKAPISPKPEPESALAVPRLLPARGHLRNPSNVPVGPSSVTLSSYSNMFGENSVVYDSPEESSSGTPSHLSFASSSNFEILTRPSAVILASSQASSAVHQTSRSRFSEVSDRDSGIGAFPRPSFAKDDFPRDSFESWGNIATAR